jgi:cytidylate kinase
LVETTHVALKREDHELRVLLDGVDVTGLIRAPEVTKTVSVVSGIKVVRAAMVREQRAMGAGGGVVLEGRDIGTVVYPDADLKIFLVASLKERARRRLQELRLQEADANLEAVEREMSERDRQDSTRAESPLRKAHDAVEIDTTGLTIEAQVTQIVTRAKAIAGGGGRE